MSVSSQILGTFPRQIRFIFNFSGPSQIGDILFVVNEHILWFYQLILFNVWVLSNFITNFFMSDEACCEICLLSINRRHFSVCTAGSSSLFSFSVFRWHQTLCTTNQPIKRTLSVFFLTFLVSLFGAIFNRFLYLCQKLVKFLFANDSLTILLLQLVANVVRIEEVIICLLTINLLISSSFGRKVERRFINDVLGHFQGFYLRL